MIPERKKTKKKAKIQCRFWTQNSTCLVPTYLFLNVGSFIGRGSRQDAGVAEAGLQQRDDHKDKESSSDDGDAARQVIDQEGAAAEKEDRQCATHISAAAAADSFSWSSRGHGRTSFKARQRHNQSICSSFHFPLRLVLLSRPRVGWILPSSCQKQILLLNYWMTSYWLCATPCSTPTKWILLVFSHSAEWTGLIIPNFSEHRLNMIQFS